MKISICQISSKCGDIIGNYNLIVEHYLKAQSDNADICIFPFALSGTSPADLLLYKEFLDEINKYLNNLIKITAKTALIVPTLLREEGRLHNSIIIAQNQQLIGRSDQENLLDSRYSSEFSYNIVNINGVDIGIASDIISKSSCSKFKNIKLLIILSSSIYEENILDKRISLIKEIFKQISVPIIYCNQVGSHDGIIFDGSSFCFDGNLSILGKYLEPNHSLINMNDNHFECNDVIKLLPNENEKIYLALVKATRDYVIDNGFKKVILGLSGGIDSAMVACIARDAFGSKNVHALMLRSKFTSRESIADAKEIAEILDINFDSISIDNIIGHFCADVNKVINIKEESITHQNLQARVRGNILMAYANNLNALLLATSNKSESATGYASLYGDTCGAFAPIADIYKTKLYELAHYKNIIPKRIIKKPPSAELKANQKDTDSLPDYLILDDILMYYIEKKQHKSELYNRFRPDLVDKVIDLVMKSEFKRRQSPPYAKISRISLCKDYIIPITNFFKNVQD